MVKGLAAYGIGEMAKLIGYLPSGLSVLVFLFVFSVALDFEYEIVAIKGGGEVLGQASILVGDALVKNKGAQIPIKLLDVFTVALGLLIIFRKGTFDALKVMLGNKALIGVTGMLALFLAVATASIFVNASYYTQAQLTLMALHLVKILQAVVVGIAFAAVIGTETINNISKSFLYALLISCVTLILNKFGVISIGSVAGDRMETFGVVTVAVLMTFNFHQIEASKGAIEKPKMWLYLITVFVGAFAILTCAKRGVELTFLIAAGFFCFQVLLGKSVNRQLLPALFVALLLSLPSLTADFFKTTNNPYNALHGTVYQKRIFNTYKEIISIFSGEEASSTQTVFLNEATEIPLISAIDYSGAERIGKILETLSLSRENKWIGTGFWGVQYKHGFLPDSGLQILLETGVAGLISFVLTLYFVVKGARPSAKASISLAVLVLVMLSVFCNPIYMSRFVLMLFFFMFFAMQPWAREREIAS